MKKQKKFYLSGYDLYKSVLNPKIGKQEYRDLASFAENNDIYISDFKITGGNSRLLVSGMKAGSL